jgi:L-asparaginase II
MQPLRIEVTRGARVESEHAVAAAIVDADGAILFAAGDIDHPVFPRSAIKAMLALPLVETGAADRFALSDAALTLACASHAGQPAHTELARSMLQACGHDATSLRCGIHWPLSKSAANALAAAGAEPSCLHNNCSGKHAGLICLAAFLGVPAAGYEQPGHPAMRLATDALSDLTGTACDDRNIATDGCSIPTYAIPLAALARGFARFCTPSATPPARAAAAARLRHAVAAAPDMLSGPGRFDTQLTAALAPNLFIKGGAEGVWCAGLPGTGLGIAVKALDGAGRAAQAAIASLLQRHLQDPVLAAHARPQLVNWNGTIVGEVGPAGSPGRSRL